MSPDEVLFELKKLGIEMTRRSLARYEAWELIPEAVRGGLGRGRGRTSDYSKDAVGDAYVAWRLMNEFKYRKAEEIKELRKRVSRSRDGIEKDNFYSLLAVKDMYIFGALFHAWELNVPANTGFFVNFVVFEGGRGINKYSFLAHGGPEDGPVHGAIRVTYSFLENRNVTKVETTAEVWDAQSSKWIHILMIKNLDEKPSFSKAYEQVITQPEKITK